MTLAFDPADLAPLVESIVAKVLKNLDANGLGSSDRLAFPEPEAAELLGIRPHQLADARRRGEITATKVGGRIGYERSELIAYLASGREAT